MKTILRLEDLAIFLLAVYLFHDLPYPWWAFPAALMIPDASMLGYLANNKAGAIMYNIAHHRGLAVLAYLAGITAGAPAVAFAGIILLAHSSMDRVFNYGLKHYKGFKYTTLGEI